MNSERHIKIAIISGEESGDLLGAGLIVAIRQKATVELIGVGGEHLAAQGQVSLFNPTDIALMGISAIVKKLPKLIGLIDKTAKYIIDQEPDCLIIIDSPEFCHRVAKKVRRAKPNIPIVNYVCPSVWAWRPGRAKAMSSYIDHVLAILPFEPKFLADHNGPLGTYVGHPAAEKQSFIDASLLQTVLEKSRASTGVKQLLILPGSRASEIRRTIDHIKDTVLCLQERGHSLQLLLPTLPHLEAELRQRTSSWNIKPEITIDAKRKLDMFATADAALAASGTVTLELALCNVPTVALYDFDTFARLLLRWLFNGWTASLPNLIADEPVVPEYYNDQIKPGRLARELERLLYPSFARTAQIAGFVKIRNNMQTDQKPEIMAGQVVLTVVEQSKQRANGRLKQ